MGLSLKYELIRTCIDKDLLPESEHRKRTVLGLQMHAFSSASIVNLELEVGVFSLNTLDNTANIVVVEELRILMLLVVLLQWKMSVVGQQLFDIELVPSNYRLLNLFLLPFNHHLFL